LALDRFDRPSTDDAREKRALTTEERRRLTEASEGMHRTLIEFVDETGARLSEALGLIWSDVDLDAGTVTFTFQLGRGPERGQRVPLKTKGSRRTIPITAALVSRLREHKVASPRSQDEDFVFVCRTGGPLDQVNVVRRVVPRAVKRAGLEGVTFHTLRHTTGSRLIALGWDVQQVASYLGHDSTATTMRIYLHEFDAAKRRDQQRADLERGSILAAHDGSTGQQSNPPAVADLASRRDAGSARQSTAAAGV
jgi:integrase